MIKIPNHLMFVAWVSLTGCAGISPDSHVPVTNVTGFDLASPFSYTSDRRFGIKLEIIIQAGKYTSIRQDTHGVYFVGPHDCLAEKVLDPGSTLKDSSRGKIRYLADCGIYVPNEKTLPARVFIVLGSEKHSVTAVGQPASSDNAIAGIATDTSSRITATPLQAGLGAGLGVAVVNALVNVERGKFQFLDNQPIGLRERIR